MTIKYRVSGPDYDVEARGLTLEQAFVRMTALVRTGHPFVRVGGEMRQLLTHMGRFADFPDLDFDDQADRDMLRQFFLKLETSEPDDEVGRRDLMLQAVRQRRDGYSVNEETADLKRGIAGLERAA
jgi:hypothetical protein